MSLGKEACPRAKGLQGSMIGFQKTVHLETDFN